MRNTFQYLFFYYSIRVALKADSEFSLQHKLATWLAGTIKVFTTSWWPQSTLLDLSNAVSKVRSVTQDRVNFACSDLERRNSIYVLFSNQNLEWCVCNWKMDSIFSWRLAIFFYYRGAIRIGLYSASKDNNVYSLITTITKNLRQFYWLRRPVTDLKLGWVTNDRKRLPSWSSSIWDITF